MTTLCDRLISLMLNEPEQWSAGGHYMTYHGSPSVMIWIHSGRGHYHTESRDIGPTKFSFFEKLRLHQAIQTWQAQGLFHSINGPTP